MSGQTVAGILLVVGPLVGAVGVASLPWRAWMVPREEHLQIVATHRTAWVLVNAGFLLATVFSAAGLAVLATTLSGDPVRVAVAAETVAYAIVGTLWCAVLAIRDRTTPALAALVEAGQPTEPAETLLAALNGGLFAAFVLGAGATLVALGATLGLTGGVASPVAWVAAGLALVPIAQFARTGDAIPAILYLPTTLIGIALLAGWT